MDGSFGGGLTVQTAAARQAAIPVQADSDATLLRLWLHGRAPATQAAYQADAAAFMAHAGVPLRAATLGDLQAWADSLGALKPASRARKLSSVKSLFGFGHRLGHLAWDIGAALRLPPVRGALAEKIISEGQVHRLLALEPDPRNAALLHLAYAAGLRVSEVAGLRWRDLVERGDAGQVTVFGKGGRTRAVLLAPSTWRALMGLRGDAGPDAPVFPSGRGGGHLCRKAIWSAVKKAAARAGLPAGVSPHYLRHAHVSHALDRGAPAHLVQATVGHASLATTSRYAHARPGDSSARYLGL